MKIRINLRFSAALVLLILCAVLFQNCEKGFDTKGISNTSLEVPIAVEEEPASVKLLLGYSGTAISVNANSTAPLNYQWYKNNLVIAENNTSQIVVANADPSHSGVYKVVITNSTGAIYQSANVNLEVIDKTLVCPTTVATPVISQPLLATGVPLGFTNIAMSVYYQVDANMTATWFKDLKEYKGIAGHTSLSIRNNNSAHIIVMNAALSDSGSYLVILNNHFGCTISENRLDVYTPL